MIERLNMDLMERDIYIESLTKRLHEDCNLELEPAAAASAKKAISYESITSGTVESIVKRISMESTKTSACKCNVSKCKCDQIAAVPSKSLNVSKKFSKPNLKKVESKLNISKSQIDTAQFEKMLNEVLLLRKQNTDLENELKRVKNDLMQVSKMVDEVEQQRCSNQQLECELESIKSTFNVELEQMSSKYQSSVNEKVLELNQIESRLACEIEKAQKLEQKISEACSELSNFKEYREKCEILQKSCAQHAGKAREAEIFKNDCQAYFKENQELKRKISELNCQLEHLKCDVENVSVKSMKTGCLNNREIIKKSVIDFKRHYDEKVQMIKCYEEKIKILERDNKQLQSKFTSFSNESING